MTAPLPMSLEKALMDKIYIISFTKNGAELSLKLKKLYPDAEVYGKYGDENIKLLDKDIKSFVSGIFNKSKAISDGTPRNATEPTVIALIGIIILKFVAIRLYPYKTK